MSESRAHLDLVLKAVSYIKEIVPEEYQGLIYFDSPDTVRPPKIENNYVPDVYYCYKDLLIIGEAKTYEDFERNHSKLQYQAYLKETIKFNGSSIIVVSVPWQIVPTAKNLLRRFKNNTNSTAKIIVINELGSCFEI